MYLQRAAFTNTFLVDLLPAHGLAQIVGAVLLGIATALTATRQPLLRVLTAVILGGGDSVVSRVAYLT